VLPKVSASRSRKTQVMLCFYQAGAPVQAVGGSSRASSSCNDSVC